MPIARGAASRAILAHLKLAQLRALHERQPREFRRIGMGASFDEVQAYLRRIRKQGYCASRGEVTPGVIGIASMIASSTVAPGIAASRSWAR